MHQLTATWKKKKKEIDFLLFFSLMKESVVTNPRDAWERDRSVTESLWPDILLQGSLESVYQGQYITVMMLTMHTPNVRRLAEIFTIFIFIR